MGGGIDVWEGASGASRDAPRFGLKSNSVSNARKKLVKREFQLEVKFDSAAYLSVFLTFL